VSASPEQDRAKLVHNEQVKLTAGWLNTLSGGLAAAGVFGPLFATAFGLVTPRLPGWAMIAIGVGCVTVSYVLHHVGRRWLRKLR
jgi:hypothetical protein